MSCLVYDASNDSVGEDVEFESSMCHTQLLSALGAGLFPVGYRNALLHRLV